MSQYFKQSITYLFGVLCTTHVSSIKLSENKARDLRDNELLSSYSANFIAKRDKVLNEWEFKATEHSMKRTVCGSFLKPALSSYDGFIV